MTLKFLLGAWLDLHRCSGAEMMSHNHFSRTPCQRFVLGRLVLSVWNMKLQRARGKLLGVGQEYLRFWEPLFRFLIDVLGYQR